MYWKDMTPPVSTVGCHIKKYTSHTDLAAGVFTDTCKSQVVKSLTNAQMQLTCVVTMSSHSTIRSPKMQPRISMITLGVKDLARSIEFYEQGLGFPRMESPPEVAFFNLNGTWLGLYGREALAEDATVSPEGSGFPGFALAHNVSSEAEVDSTLAEAVTAGATLVKPGQKVFWGGYSGYFKDSDGYLWEIAHNPLMWVGPPNIDA